MNQERRRPDLLKGKTHKPAPLQQHSEHNAAANTPIRHEGKYKNWYRIAVQYTLHYFTYLHNLPPNSGNNRLVCASENYNYIHVLGHACS